LAGPAEVRRVGKRGPKAVIVCAAPIGGRATMRLPGKGRASSPARCVAAP